MKQTELINATLAIYMPISIVSKQPIISNCNQSSFIRSDHNHLLEPPDSRRPKSRHHKNRLKSIPLNLLRIHVDYIDKLHIQKQNDVNDSNMQQDVLNIKPHMNVYA